MIRRIPSERGPLGSRAAARGLLALIALSALLSPATAQDAVGAVKGAAKGVAKALGFATDVGPPADFVLQSRPTGDLDYIPVFQPPPEPARPALKDNELKGLKGDLDSVQKAHDTLRQAYPPAAKALAEQEAAKKKPKPNAPEAGQNAPH